MSEEFETDVEISKVYEGKSGEGEFGKWTAYNFYVKGDERKFSWFKTDSKPIMPVQGMRIKLMEYVVKQTGQYTNYNVSRIILHETKTDAKPSTGFVGQKTGRDSTLTMYISYAKDLLVAHLLHGDYTGTSFNQLVDIVVAEGKRMYDMANEIDTATREAEKGFLDDEQRQEPDFPEDRFPPASAYGDK